MSTELIIFLASFAVVLISIGLGWFLGGSGIIRYLLASLFAVLAALRFWYPAYSVLSGNVSMDPFYVAGSLFVVLFLVFLAVGGAAVRFKAPRFQSVLPDPVDKTLGVIFGLVLGLILGGAALLDASLFCAGAKGEIDTAKFPARLDAVPAGIFRHIESNLAGVPDNAQTLLPTVKMETAAEGAVAATPHPVIAWN